MAMATVQSTAVARPEFTGTVRSGWWLLPSVAAGAGLWGLIIYSLFF